MAMSSMDLRAILQAERNSCLGVQAGKLSEERTRALDYYAGDMDDDMPVEDGQSSAVSTDVADTVEGLMPTLMDIFCGSDQVVRFEPIGPEDVPAAEQETDYVNHVFTQKNPGFLVLYSFIKDALLSKVGIVKVAWEQEDREQRQTYTDQPDDVFAALVMDPTVEVVEHSENVDDQGVRTHDVTLVLKSTYKCAKVYPVPPEEFGVSQWARNISEANYAFHEPSGKTEADLIALGYDEDQVKTLPSMSVPTAAEELARNTVEETTASDTVNRPMRVIKVTEHYIRMDYKGDGKPALYRVTTGGDQLEILRRDGEDDVVAVDEMPFAVMSPVLITHRFYGRSIADLVIDIQKQKTALIRSLLNNLYLLNNQRVEVAETHAHERTLDDLAVNRPGGVVRTKQPGGIMPIVNQPIGQFVYPALEYLDATREWRTGVTRQGMGLDANALQNNTATAVAQQFSASQARIKLIARIFAETGIRDLFRLLHSTIRKNDQQINTVRLRNKWVQVDPRVWKIREDMTVEVGLGTGSKQEQIANLMNLLNVQKEIGMAGLTTVVTPKNIYNTVAKLIEKVDLKVPDPYVTDPDQAPPQPPPPNPEMEKMQKQLQIEQMQAQADIEVNKTKTQNQFELEKMKFEFERELALQQHQMKMQEHQVNMAAQQQTQQFAEADHKRGREYRDIESLAKNPHAIDAVNAAAQAIDQVAQRFEMTAQATAQMFAEAARKLNAPKRVVRDPASNRVVGVETVDNGPSGPPVN